MTEKIYVSAEGLVKMRSGLAQMNEDRIRIAETIEHARGLGDLKENAEYHAAKEAQAHLHARIRDLEDKITRAVVINHNELDHRKALVGAAVRVLNRKTKKEVTYILVSPVEADMASGKISTKSPVGQALLGHEVGEVVVAKVPAGAIELEILEISR
jgi:transcription elongation factor GreA